MSWDAIAAIAEGLGAIGVIATVIYLAFQIRQNTNSIQGSTQQALMSQEITMYALLAQYSNVFRRGCASIEDLDADEAATFEHLHFEWRKNKSRSLSLGHESRDAPDGF